MAHHVRDELKGLVDLKKVALFTTHDGAKNMVKASMALKSQNYAHCAAHALNLLLMNYGMDQVTEICTLLASCREIVTTLHFKGHMIEDAMSDERNCKLIDAMMARIAETRSTLDLDEQIVYEGVSIGSQP
jgi:hypothetical protein